MQDYKRLHVWARAHAHNLELRKTTNRFPRTGFTALKSQMTTAAESIAFNIVEGCGASTDKEYARFLEISIKSAFELEYQLLLSRDYGVLAPRNWDILSSETVEIRKMLYGLRKTVLGASSNPQGPDVSV